MLPSPRSAAISGDDQTGPAKKPRTIASELAAPFLISYCTEYSVYSPDIPSRARRRVESSASGKTIGELLPDCRPSTKRLGSRYDGPDDRLLEFKQNNLRIRSQAQRRPPSSRSARSEDEHLANPAQAIDELTVNPAGSGRKSFANGDEFGQKAEELPMATAQIQ